MSDNSTRWPGTDTRPLDSGQLVEPEEQLILNLHAALKGMLDDNGDRAHARRRAELRQATFGTRRVETGGATRRALEADPWAKPDETRSHRVVFLTGVRGSGKTSLLLTLLNAWRPENAADVEPPFDREVTARVRALPPLDFDPHPRGLHPFPWLVQAMEPLVRWIAATEGVDGWGGDAGLGRRWHELYRDALLSFPDTQTDRAELARDLDEFVVDSEVWQGGWRLLRENWQAFMDDLLRALERADHLPRGGLLVLPIDDLDMQPSGAAELLLALRLTWHERLVFLVTGHERQLRRVVSRELAKALRQSEVDEPDELRKHAGRLAADLVDKIIPPNHRFHLPLLPILEALKIAGPKGDVELESWLTEALLRPLAERSPPATEQDAERRRRLEEDYRRRVSRVCANMVAQLKQFEEFREFKRPDAVDGVRFRNLQGVLESTREVTRERVWRIIASVVDADGFPALGEPAEKTVEVYARRRGGIGDPWTARTIDFRWTKSNAELIRPLTPSEVVALDFGAELEIGPWRDRPILERVWLSPLRWSGRAGVELRWPTYVPPVSPAQAHQQVEDLKVLGRQDEGLLDWLRLQLHWGRGGDPPRLATDEAALERLLALETIDELLDELWERPEMREWLCQQFVILAAPEYHLSEAQQTALLNGLRRRIELDRVDRWSEAMQAADAARLEATTAAVRRRRGPVENQEGLRVEAERLIREFDDANPRAPWHTRKAPPGAWYLVPIRPDRRVVDGLQASIHAGHGAVSLRELFRVPASSPNEWVPHWASVALESLFDVRDVRQSLLDAVVQLDRQRGSVGWALTLVTIWRAILKGLGPVPGLRRQGLHRWFDTTEDARHVVYRGPALRWEPKMERLEWRGQLPAVVPQRVVGWKEVNFGWPAEGRIRDGVLGWTLVMQTAMALQRESEDRSPQAAIDFERPALLLARNGDLPPPPAEPWVAWAVFSRRWDDALQRLDELSWSRAPGGGLQRWLLAAWMELARNCLAWPQEAGWLQLPSFPVEPKEFGYHARYPLPAHRREAQSWRASIELDGLLDEDDVSAWNAGLRGAELEPAPRTPEERALHFANHATPDQLQACVRYQPAVRNIVKARQERRLDSIDALRLLDQVGPTVIERLLKREEA